MRLSFCITCMGRLHHLRQTLPRNLEWTAGVAGVEFVLLNYSSPDGLDDWVRVELLEMIMAGRLNYEVVNGCQHFAMAHAKNVAHRRAGGEIVCNLDADNFLGAGFAEFLMETFEGQKRTFVRAPLARDSAGRIAFLKDDFIALGGYDERMDCGWGYDDRDIQARALGFGLKEIVIPNDQRWLKALPHSHGERIRFAAQKDPHVSDTRHQILSKEAIAAGHYVANAGKRWGEARCGRNFGIVRKSANSANAA